MEGISHFFSGVTMKRSTRHLNAQGELDPFSLICERQPTARAFYWGKRYDEAIARPRARWRSDPKFGVALFWLEGSLRHKGMFKEAVTLRLAVDRLPERGKAIEDALKVGRISKLVARRGRAIQKRRRVARGCTLSLTGWTENGSARLLRELLSTPVFLHGDCEDRT